MSLVTIVGNKLGVSVVSDGTMLLGEEANLNTFGKSRQYKEYIVSLNGIMKKDLFLELFEMIEKILEQAITNKQAFKELEDTFRKISFTKDQQEVFLVFAGFRNGQGYLFSTSNLPEEKTHKLRLTEDTRFLIMSRSDAYKKYVDLFQTMLSEKEVKSFESIQEVQQIFNEELSKLDNTINTKLSAITLMNPTAH